MLFEMLIGTVLIGYGTNYVTRREARFSRGYFKIQGRSAEFIGFGMILGGITILVSQLYQLAALNKSDEIGFWTGVLALFCIGLGFGAALLNGIFNAAIKLGEDIREVKHNPRLQHPLEDQHDELPYV